MPMHCYFAAKIIFVPNLKTKVMKNFNTGFVLLFFGFFCLCNNSLAQKLAGVTFSGGKLGGGIVYRVDVNSIQLTDIKDFDSYLLDPEIILGKDGNIYGYSYS